MPAKLIGRILLNGAIETLSGLHIGGSPGALAIGGVDSPVIRNARNNQPYIPGSSLKGKLRSLSEKWSGAPQNKDIQRGREDGSGKVSLHIAQNKAEYQQYWVNPVFGIPSDIPADWDIAPNRLVVRDVPLDPDSARELLNTRTDLPFTEVKWETAIDRVTSAATPRQIERVPAGTIFAPLVMIFNIYVLPKDLELFGNLLMALKLLEEDYLGGLGTRGSGQIAFRKLSVELRCGKEYSVVKDEARFANLVLPELISRKDALLQWAEDCLSR